jgi:hypothetical protein
MPLSFSLRLPSIAPAPAIHKGNVAPRVRRDQLDKLFSLWVKYFIMGEGDAR